MCVVVVGVAAPTAPLARWVHGAVDDTDAYVAAVAPLARDPELHDRLAADVTARLLETVDAEAGVREALGSVLGPLVSLPGVGPLLDDAVAAGGAQVREAVAAGVRGAVGTEAFAAAWDAAQRAAHAGVRWSLTSPDVSDAHRPPVGVDADGAVVLDLGTVADAVVEHLEDVRVPVPQALRDLPAAAGVVERLDALRVPVPQALRDVDARVPVVSSERLDRARDALGVVDAWGVAAPWVVAAAVAGALAAARRRWVALVACGAAVLVGSVVVLAGGRVAAREVVGRLELPSEGVLALVTDRVVEQLVGGLPSLLAPGALLGAAALALGAALGAAAAARDRGPRRTPDLTAPAPAPPLPPSPTRSP